jgi:hypothetical protein
LSKGAFIYVYASVQLKCKFNVSESFELVQEIFYKERPVVKSFMIMSVLALKSLRLKIYLYHTHCLFYMPTYYKK